MNTRPPAPEGSNADDAASALPSHYTPRHVKRKMGMVIVGLVVFAFGWSELGPPLSLWLWGNQAWGEATRVIKTKPGLPEQVFTDDVELNAAEEKHDRAYVFWNEFKFVSADNQEHVVRFNIGSQLKPLFQLHDEDGLSTTVQIYYDPKNPDRICIPIVFSTWFAPGLITFIGAVCILFGCLILYWARRTIEIS